MQNSKNKAFSVLSMLILLTMLFCINSTQAHAAGEITVNGSVEKGKIEVELTNDNIADTIIINLFPDNLYFAEQFVGFNFVYPGLNFTGDFIIKNNTGQAYRVTDFSFEADTAYIKRVYNDAAEGKYGKMTGENYEIVKNLSGEEWYQLNADYYGSENFYNIDIARNILGYGDLSQGIALGVETSPELIELGEWYLFNKSQFSFDTDKYSINNLDVKNITLQDYIDKTSDNIDLVLNSFFSQEIGENGFTSTIGYSIDNPSVGNAYNGAYSDFKFTLTLSRIIKGVKVSYNGNGNTDGVTPFDDNLYEAGSSVIVMDNIGHLEKKGFTFKEWNTSPDGNGTSFNGGDSFFIDRDITLYAQWIPVTNPLPPTTTPSLPSYPTIPAPQVSSPVITEIIDSETPLGNLDRFNHIKYIYGYPDGSVRPDSSITRSEAASIFFRLLTDSIKNHDRPQAFDDVPNGRWYSQAVNYLAYIGVLSGYKDGTFMPDASITRAEFATIASKFEALELTEKNIFIDVPSNHWASEYINSAYKKGWINGYDNETFEPERNITRVEVVTLVNTMLDRLVLSKDLDDALNPFNDLTRNHWGYAHILEASLDHLYIRNDSGSEIWTSVYSH